MGEIKTMIQEKIKELNDEYDFPASAQRLTLNRAGRFVELQEHLTVGDYIIRPNEHLSLEGCAVTENFKQRKIIRDQEYDAEVERDAEAAAGVPDAELCNICMVRKADTQTSCCEKAICLKCLKRLREDTKRRCPFCRKGLVTGESETIFLS